MDPTSKEYVPIPISEFVSGVLIQVDLHIRLSEEKFVMVARAGVLSDVSQFKNYQNKEVAYLWVRKTEYHKISQQAISIAGMVVKRKDLNDRTKAVVVTQAARAVFRQIEHFGFDYAGYVASRQVMEAVIALTENHKSLSDLLESLHQCSDRFLAHSMGVSMFSMMIGQRMGFENRATIEKLALGGLLHDIGKKALPASTYDKGLAQMTPEEIQHYESHSFKGMQMLQSIGMVPDDIVSIVYEHHENTIGQGFPQKIREVKIHPLAKIVGIADAYTNLIIASPHCPQPKNPREALMYIEHTLGLPYNRDAFRALKRIIEGEKKAA